MSHLKQRQLFHSIPPAIAPGGEDENLRCEMRSSQKNNFLGYHQENMPAKKTLDLDPLP